MAIAYIGVRKSENKDGRPREQTSLVPASYRQSEEMSTTGRRQVRTLLLSLNGGKSES